MYAGSSLAKGDANGDGVVDAKDVQAIADYLTGNPGAAADLNAVYLTENGVVDIRDLTQLICILTGSE